MTFLMGPALLFCPADRPERYQKAAERADAVIVDLEDAVAPADKQRARGAILAQLGATGDVPELDPSRTIVRINPAGTEEFEKDLHCLKHTPYRHVMLAKAESAAQLKELEGYSVIALVRDGAGSRQRRRHRRRTQRGGPDVGRRGPARLPRRHLQQERTTAATVPWRCTPAPPCCWPPGRSARKPSTRSTSTSRTLTASPSKPATPSPPDSAPRPASTRTRWPWSAEAYAPSEADVAAATELLAAAAAAGSGVFQFNGKMIDGPILKHAESTLRRAGH